MQVSSSCASTQFASISSKVSDPVSPPPSGGKIGFSPLDKSTDGKIGFTPPPDGKIGRLVDVRA